MHGLINKTGGLEQECSNCDVEAPEYTGLHWTIKMSSYRKSF